VESNQKYNPEIRESEELSKPLGEVMLPMVICGFVGVVFTVFLSVIGIYDGIDEALKKYYMAKPFYMVEYSEWSEVWDWLLVVLLSFGISFTVLDTDKRWRRIVIIVLFSVVVLLTSPVLMLCDVFWSPVILFVGMFWSWIFAFVYSCQHTMPCELLIPKVNENLNDQSSCPD